MLHGQISFIVFVNGFSKKHLHNNQNWVGQQENSDYKVLLSIDLRIVTEYLQIKLLAKE